MNIRKAILLSVAILVGLGIVYTTLTYARPYTFQGSLIEPPVPAPDFELVDQHGHPFHLSEQKDKVILAFFGYTHCPDVCPVTLADFKKIKSQLGDRSKDVAFLFISTDPERDTPDQLLNYLKNFDPEFVGLTGDQSLMETVWQEYGVYQQKVESGEPENYLVDHSARTYVIDKHGNLRLTYLFGTGSEVIAEDVLHLLKENQESVR
jgi:protein SCO1/2